MEFSPPDARPMSLVPSGASLNLLVLLLLLLMLVLMRSHTAEHTDANQILLLCPIDGVGVVEVDTDDGDDDYVSC